MSDSFMKQLIIPSGYSGVMSGTNMIKSAPFWLVKFSGCSFQPVWSGDPAGTFTVMVSNDFQPAANGSTLMPINAGTWTALPGATIPANPSGSAGNTFVSIYASCAYWVQLWYTNTTGTGTLSGTFVGKYSG